jgi:hypothetical protein
VKVPAACVADAVPSSKVTSCGLRPPHVQVTAVPRGTVVAPGLNELSATVTLLDVLFPALFPALEPWLPVEGPAGSSLPPPHAARRRSGTSLLEYRTTTCLR